MSPAPPAAIATAIAGTGALAATSAIAAACASPRSALACCRWRCRCDLRGEHQADGGRRIADLENREDERDTSRAITQQRDGMRGEQQPKGPLAQRARARTERGIGDGRDGERPADRARGQVTAAVTVSRS